MASPPDDYAAFVRARVDELWRIALLVTGDGDHASLAVRHGVAALARVWGSDLGERPEVILPGEVARAAQHLPTHSERPGPPGPAPPRGDEEEVADAGDAHDAEHMHDADDVQDADDIRQAAAVWSALAELSPRQRAVLTLTSYAGLEPDDVADTLHLRRSVVVEEQRGAEAALRHTGAGASVWADAPTLLALAVDTAALRLPEVDGDEVVQDAWRAHQERRSRRRLLGLGVAGLVVVGTGAAGVLAARDDATTSDPDRGAPDTPGPTGPASEAMPDGPQLRFVESQGLTIDLAPGSEEQQRLPEWAGRGSLRLPSPLGFAAGAGIPPLTGRDDRVVAVLLRVVARAQQWRPVLVLGASGRMAEVDVTLRRTATGGAPLSPTCVSDDAHRVVLPVERDVAVVDVRSGKVRRFDVPDGAIASVGWTAGSRFVVVRGASAWRLDPTSGRLLRAFASDAGHAIIVPRSGSNVVIVNNDRGISQQLKAMPRAVKGVGRVAVSDAVPQVADAVTFHPVTQQETGRLGGLYAAEVTTMRSRGLAALDEPGTPQPALRPRLWAGRGVLLLSSTGFRSGAATDRLLVWETMAGRLWRAGEVVPASSQPGAFSGHYVLGPKA